MNKYALAAQHSGGSIAGILRIFTQTPGFALTLFRRRFRYFATRSFEGTLITPDRFLIDKPDTLIAYWSMFVERELYHPQWIQTVKAESRPLVVDVGANAGVFSHYAWCANPKAEIIAFEPLPAMHGRLKDMKERTGMDFTCHPLAVSRSVGEVLFESPSGYDGTSRISTTEKPAGKTFRVQTTTLDTILPDRPVTLMKVDVEGFECDVIAGGPRTLSRTRNLIIEAHTPEHLARITEALGAGWERRKLGSSDHLFFRPGPIR